jgi:uncharacterized protein YqjF (DUF2071 family)
MTIKKPVFLKAEWRNLIFANYEIDPQILLPYLPYGTELDLWEGKCYVSIVAFEFKETAVLGIKFPFHTNFEEINLRFYVRYNDNNVWKRGVVFIKEIVPKVMITFIANTLYNENYATHRTKYFIQNTDKQLIIKYEWLNKNKWNMVQAKASTIKQAIVPNTEAEFITEHYWGYARANAHKTTEYEVVHPSWQIHPIIDFEIDADFVDLYGQAFAFLAYTKPSSVFMADGSEVSVLKGQTIRK